MAQEIKIPLADNMKTKFAQFVIYYARYKIQAMFYMTEQKSIGIFLTTHSKNKGFEANTRSVSCLPIILLNCKRLLHIRCNTTAKTNFNYEQFKWIYSPEILRLFKWQHAKNDDAPNFLHWNTPTRGWRIPIHNKNQYRFIIHTGVVG